MNSRCRSVLLLTSVLAMGAPAVAAKHGHWLVAAPSPYLAAHAEDDVAWQPWGAPLGKGRLAFVLLGRFGSPRWAAQEHELLASPEVREALRRHVTPVLVDVDERPDVAELCRLAARLGTEIPASALDGPLVAILTPDGRPVLVRPAGAALARTLVVWIDEYRRSPTNVEARAGAMAAQLGMRAVSSGDTHDGRAFVARVLRGLRDTFDAEHGAFGREPQRPPHAALRLLLAEAARQGDAEARRMAVTTLDALIRGGIHDHVGGGFFRATSDPAWRLPRFEKTLADNALLLEALVSAHALTGSAAYRETAISTVSWILRDLPLSQGGFMHALAAGPAGDEGRFYRFTEADLRVALDRDGIRTLLRGFTLDPTGLLLPRRSDVLAARAERERLLAQRSQREAPARDARMFTYANGLALGALAASGRAFHRPEDTAAAERAAFAIVDGLGPLDALKRFDRGLPRSAQLEDYACLAWGLARLSEATGEARWAELGAQVVDAALDRLLDPEAGGFFATEANERPFSVRSRPVFDGDRPGANGLMAEALTRLAALTGQKRLRDLARRHVRALAQETGAAPSGFEGLALAASLLEARPASQRLALPSQRAPIEAARAAVGPVRAEARLPVRRVRPGERADVEVVLRIPPGFVVPSAHPQDDDLVPTTVSIIDDQLETLHIRYPDGAPQRQAFSPRTVRVYEGDVSVVAVLQVPPAMPEGSHMVRVRIRLQACQGRACAPPESAMLTLLVDIAPQR